MHSLLRSFRSRNYRLFFSGQAISLLGTWIQQVALSWYVYNLTNSAWLLGLTVFLNQIPSFLLSPLAGVAADRFNKRWLLILTQGLSLIQALILAGLLFTHSADIGVVLGLSFFLGLVNSLDAPVRQSFVVELVEDRADLPNAIALNSALFNSARLVGPAVGGLLIVAVGEAVCFLLNGLSYIAVILALLAMKTHRPSAPADQGKILAHLKEGLTYAFQFGPIRLIILAMSVISLAGLSYMTLLPILARDILGGDALTLGLLTGCAGLGALGAALYLANRQTIKGLLRVMAWATFGLAVGLGALGFVKVLWLSLPILVLLGFTMILIVGACNTILQTIVDNDKRGRVMSLYTMAFMGMAPLGSLLLGWLSHVIGFGPTLWSSAAACLVWGLIFVGQLPAARADLRPVYQRLGL